jgi:hypothetical protein
VTMAEGTRTSQLAKALTKLREECRAESQKLTQLSDAFSTQSQKLTQLSDSVNKQQETSNKLEADNKAFQSRTEENLHVTMEALEIKAPEQNPGGMMSQGETSGEKSPNIPGQNLGGMMSQGDTNGEKMGGEGVIPGSSGSYIPTALEGAGINPRSVNLDFPKFDGNDPTNWVLKAQQFFVYGQVPDNQRVPIAYFHMEGKALQWYNW